MDTGATHAEALSVVASPAGDHAYWETENRMVWNEQQHIAEERELVYEISWIVELSAWRRFLASNRFSRSHTSSMSRMVLAGLSGSCIV